MRQLSISQYIESLESGYNMFRTLPRVELMRDAYGRPLMSAGNSAVVFRVRVNGQEYGLKCYIRAGNNLNKKYEYVRSMNDACPFIVEMNYLSGELAVFDNCGTPFYGDVAFGPWQNGHTLGMELSRAVNSNDSDRIGELASMFDDMACTLLRQPWAHGDIKPDNIIVDVSNAIRLIDYDAVFIPSLANEPTNEIGTPAFQHPCRDASMYNKHIDDYSLALISSSLHVLAYEPALYEKYYKGDNIIFDPQQLLAQSSAAYRDAQTIALDREDAELSNLLSALCSKTPVIEGINELMSDVKEKRLGARQGRFMKNCQHYDEVRPVVNGYAAVRVGEKWGFVDYEGECALSPRFDSVSSFREGCAVVRSEGKYGYIYPDGTWLKPPIYDYAKSFKNGRAEVQFGAETTYLYKNIAE